MNDTEDEIPASKEEVIAGLQTEINRLDELERMVNAQRIEEGFPVPPHGDFVIGSHVD